MAEEIKNSATEEDYEPDLITLEDEDGQECTFEVIDATDYEGVHYLALVREVANAEDGQAAKTVGMNEHIAKPLDLRVLAKTLKKWLRGK